MQDRYVAYMLRLWQVGDSVAWRASLEDPHTGEHHVFASPEALFEFLNALTAEPPPPPFALVVNEPRT